MPRVDEESAPPQPADSALAQLLLKAVPRDKTFVVEASQKVLDACAETLGPVEMCHGQPSQVRVIHHTRQWSVMPCPRLLCMKHMCVVARSDTFNVSSLFFPLQAISFEWLWYQQS